MDFQVAESLLNYGLFDLDISLKLLKGVLSEIFELYGSTLNICRERNHTFSK
jgi:hypothetical protein